MTDVSDIAAYFNRMEQIGLGHCKAGLCRRGMDLTKEVLSLVIPIDGEQVSDDGSTVFLSARRVEE